MQALGGRVRPHAQRDQQRVGRRAAHEMLQQLEGEVQTLTAGQQVTIPPGAAHHYANASQQDVVFGFDVWPAARFEAMVVTLFALGMEGRTDSKGAPSPLQMAVILDEYGDVMEIVGPPRWLQRLAIPLLARIGRARGLRASYPHHDEGYARWQQQARTADPVGSLA